MVMSCSILVTMRNISDNFYTENQSTYYAQRRLSKNRDVYEIMWKNMVEPDRSQIRIWRMRITCCIPKATNILSEYIILIAYPMHEWLRERAWILR